MELLQLIVSVLAGLGAGILGALHITRREQGSNHQLDVADRLLELEHQYEAERDRVEQLSEALDARSRDVVHRLQAALVTRDERLDALQTKLHRIGRGSQEASSHLPQVRLQERLETTTERIDGVQSSIARLEQQVQSKLIAFRESTQEVLRKLADHQVGEAARVSRLAEATEALGRRVDALAVMHGEDRPTTAALVEVLETQVVLTERASDLESRVEEGLRQLEHHLGDVESRLAAFDAVKAQLADSRPEYEGLVGSLQSRIAELEARLARAVESAKGSPSAEKIEPHPPLDDLKQIFGIGPKMAERLAAQGVADVASLARLSEADIDRITENIRGFRERALRHDWIGQAQKVVEQHEARAALEGQASGATAPPQTPAPEHAAPEHAAADPAAPAPAATSAWPAPSVADPDSMH